MLKFARNKLVSIHQKDQDTLWVHGVLDDDIYGLEVDVTVRISDLALTAVQGKWNRYTTPDCPRSLDYLHEAEGLCIEAGFAGKIQKLIGRKACRHFATLLIECGKSVQEAVSILKWCEASRKDPQLSYEDFVNSVHSTGSDTSDAKETRPDSTAPAVSPGDASQASPIAVAPKEIDLKAAKPTGGFVIDLHAHTYPASPCATDSVELLLEESKRIGLDGVCLTDHNHRWSAADVAELQQKYGILILTGNEVTTDQGHMVVFGLDKDLNGGGIVKLQDLRAEVEAVGGFIILAHPFRGFLTFGVGELGLTVEKAAQRPLFKWVDAVEVLNGKVTREENRFAAQVAAKLNLPTTGGSDAHDRSEVGCYATEFSAPIRDEKSFLAALKSGAYNPVVYRK